MQRVMIIGGPGSGKSTLARILGARLNLPVHHMDHIHWQPGWVQRSTSERLDMAKHIEAQPRWVFEGGFSMTYASRAARADTLIWLDLPVGLRMWRVTKRLFRYWGQRRPDMAEGCFEGVHRETFAFYHWIWDNRHVGRAKAMQLIDEQGAALDVIHLRSPKAVRCFLDGLPVRSDRNA